MEAQAEVSVHRGVPTFVRASCYEARLGGSGGYESVGWHLANSVSSLVEGENGRQIEAKLTELMRSCRARTGTASLHGSAASSRPA